jgi:hypothetical protein
MLTVLKTKAGSIVTIRDSGVHVEFDWLEEDYACIDCVVDVDLSRATGWKELMWRCETDDNHNCAYATLHPIK